MRWDDFEENKVVPLIFKQFWSRSHLNKRNSISINWFLSAKYLTFPLQHSRHQLFLCFSFANYLWLYWIGHQPIPFFENWSGRFYQRAFGKVQPWWVWLCISVKQLKTDLFLISLYALEDKFSCLGSAKTTSRKSNRFPCFNHST